jgi:transposase
VPTDSGDDAMSQIITLRSQGYSLTEIAKMLGMGMGEIQLLINMNHKK